MDSLAGVLAWIQGLPQGALLGVMALLAAVENVFPPIPADVLVAFGAFMAARGGHSSVPVFLAVWLGNMAGVAGMYALGRRYGADRIRRRYKLDASGRADQRVQLLYQRYGTLALFISRFVPGVRAVVPPVAGALRIPAGRTLLATSAASGLWYGAITILATRAGDNWEVLKEAIGRLGTWTAGGATIVVGVVAGIIWWRRRRERARTA